MVTARRMGSKNGTERLKQTALNSSQPTGKIVQDKEIHEEEEIQPEEYEELAVSKQSRDGRVDRTSEDKRRAETVTKTATT